MDRNDWSEEMPQAPSRRPFREPSYQQGYRPRQSEYSRDNSDFQSRDTGNTSYHQSPSQYYNGSTGYQPRSDSNYARKNDSSRGDRPRYSRENSRDPEFYEAPPPQPYSQEHRGDYAMQHRAPGYDAYRESRGSYYSRGPGYQQRYESRQFDNNENPRGQSDHYRGQRSYQQTAHDTGPVDRQHSDPKYRQSPNRYHPRTHNNSDNVPERNYQKDALSPTSPKGIVDGHTSDAFYPNWARTPKPRSRCSSTSSSKEDAPRSRDECVICYGTIKFLALTPCEHLYCHLCCIRLQILCEDQHCPICRTPFKENPVILLQNTPNPVYRDLIGSCIRDTIENFQITLHLPLDRRLIDELFNYKCPVGVCPFIPPRNDKRQLERHLKSSHELYYCHVCMQGLKLFVFEMRVYSWDELNRHKDGKGEGKLDPPGHHGHPMCKFCRDRYLDDSTLYEHLHQTHFWCFICERNNIHVYYNSTDELHFHFKQDHFLCERGDCKQEIYTTAFASEIDFKAHVSSAHAGDLKKSEAKQLRRVDLEFNYVSTHQANTDQGHRNRKQMRDRKTDQNTANDKTDQSSDNEESENNTNITAVETNHNTFNFKSDENCSNQESTIEPPRTMDNRENETPRDPISWDNDTGAETLKSSDLASNWPQIEVDSLQPVSMVNAHTATSGSEPGSRQTEKYNALSYSQSLGINKKPKQLFSSNSASQPARAPAPSPYSDIVKPELVRAQKHQSHSNPKSQPQPQPLPQDPPSEPVVAPLKKKTYEDVFPALCVPNSNAIPLQYEQQQQQQVQSTTATALGKAGKKSNKQRRKENKTSQPPITQPNESPPMNRTSNSNYLKSSPAREKPQPAAEKWPSILPETQPKKKEVSPPRNPRVVPTQQPSVNLVPYAKWQPPNKYQVRKSALETHIISSFTVNNELQQYYRNYENMINKSIPVYEFLKYFKTTFGDKFSTIFPEVLVLLPDIGLQQELLEAKEHLYPAVPFLSLPPATSSWSKQTRIQLETCPTCTQVLLPSDSIYHRGTHSTEDEFPALC